MPAYFDETTKTWYCKFYYTDYTGARKQRKKRGFRRQKDAKEWERSFLQQQQGTPDMPFQMLYDIYIEDISHRLRQYTVDIKKNMLENHVLPYLKAKPVNQITPKDIRDWQNQIIAKGFSPSYQLNINKALVAVLNYAVKYYNLPANPCRQAGYIGKVSRSMKFWTLDQYNQIIQHVTDPHAHVALQVLFYSGMRSGEFLALTLDDIHFDTNLIRVNKSYQHKKGKDLITPPKTENGIRNIAMPESVMQEVREYSQRIYGLSGSDRLFTFSRELLRGNMRRAASKADIPLIRLHDLRHSHVSLLIDMGFTPHLIAERIGDTVQMVNNTYGHLYPNRHDEVAEKLNQLIVPK